MPRSTRYLLALFAVPVIALTLLSGCGELKLFSRFKDRDIHIDGHDTEWDNARYLVDQRNILTGVINDGEYLYLRISTWDGLIKRQITEYGMTVWFKANNNPKHRLGIYFPLPAKTDTVDENDAVVDNGDEETPVFTPLPEPEPKPTSADSSLVILGPGKKDRQTLSFERAADLGVIVKMGEDGEHLVYEARIPLVSDSGESLALAKALPKSVVVNIRTGTLNYKELDEIAARDRASMGNAYRGTMSSDLPWDKTRTPAGFDLSLKIMLAPTP